MHDLENAAIAEIAHKANQEYRQAIGENRGACWDASSQSKRQGIIAGVELHRENPDTTPEESHQSWFERKKAEGWSHTETEDERAKMHPCCVPYDELPEKQKRKAVLFKAICRALLTIVLALSLFTVAGCAEGQSFGDWWSSSDDVEALQTVANDVAADSLALEIQLNEWKREAERFEEEAMTAEEEAYYDWLKGNMAAGEEQMHDFATSSDKVATAISKAKTNGDMVIMGALELLAIGVPGGYWIKRLAGPAAAFGKLVSNLKPMVESASETARIDLRSVNEASGIQPLVRAALGKK